MQQYVVILGPYCRLCVCSGELQAEREFYSFILFFYFCAKRAYHEVKCILTLYAYGMDKCSTRVTMVFN